MKMSIIVNLNRNKNIFVKALLGFSLSIVILILFYQQYLENESDNNIIPNNANFIQHVGSERLTYRNVINFYHVIMI